MSVTTEQRIVGWMVRAGYLTGVALWAIALNTFLKLRRR